MDYINAMKLLEKYSDCPNCKSDKIGNGKGGLILEDDTLIRYCECGYSIVVDKDDNEVKILCNDCNLEIKPREELFCDNCNKLMCKTCYDKHDGYCDECHELID